MKGYFMFWGVCTQCQNLCNVSMKDTKHQYFKYEKTSTSTSLLMLGQGNASLENDDLQIVIEYPSISDPNSIMRSLSTNTITDQDGNTVGQAYNICIEDQNNNDYNDIYINVVGWKKKG